MKLLHIDTNHFIFILIYKYIVYYIGNTANINNILR